uniref:Uncharacterized protein n=1 Tax=Pararge aegeria TaxID=116150 RepID=S4PCJ7_9NEOP
MTLPVTVGDTTPNAGSSDRIYCHFTLPIQLHYGYYKAWCWSGAPTQHRDVALVGHSIGNLTFVPTSFQFSVHYF